MQQNSFKLFLIAAFLLLSGYYLFPSVQNYFLANKLDRMSAEDRRAYEEKNFAHIRQVEDKALKLGLDLQGGMHVTLEVRVDALIRELATDRDATFDEVLGAARQRTVDGDVSIIDVFVQEFERRDPNARLSRYFRSSDSGITRRSTNADVAQYLRTEADEAVNRAIEIIRQRVDRFGVTEPSIQKQGTRRIVVEMPGITDPERVRNLLRGTARLEFRLTAEEDELRRSLQAVLDYFEGKPATAAADTAAADSAAAPALTAADSAQRGAPDSAALAADTLNRNANNPLLRVMQPAGTGVTFGLVAVRDTAAANRLLRRPAVRGLLPAGIELIYSASPSATTEDGRELYSLLAVRRQIELTGEVITDASVEFNEMNQASVSMTMNAEGARDWARITGANVGKPVAIVLDQVAYSWPTVINRIVGGRSSITGLESREEAQDIVTILKSGALPAPVEIVEERTVGPSLGAAAIDSGMNSAIAGLVLVAIFMIFYYRTAGLISVLALFVNIIFILGILDAFDATLTLPGIAGIVLTMVTAVDANVLIFERIREEQAMGKTLKAAVDVGYSKAFSAILDSNVTSFFVGAILYSFGVGPIQGFAVTLMAGILASLFSALVVTRVIFDYLVSARRMSVNLG